MKREYKLYIKDILECIEKIKEFVIRKILP